MILEKFTRPSLYLGTLILLWGIVMTCTGVVTNFAGLAAMRFLLGLFEAGFLPGAILLVSKWYLPNETQTRIAVLYSSAASGGAFSGLLAYAIAKMKGIAGRFGSDYVIFAGYRR
jgi:MFS family permease